MLHEQLLEKLADLHKQATTERSHFYTAKVISEAMAHIVVQQHRIEVLQAEFDRLTSRKSIAK